MRSYGKHSRTPQQLLEAAVIVLEFSPLGFGVTVCSSCGSCFLLALCFAFLASPKCHHSWHQEKGHFIILGACARWYPGVNKFRKMLILLLVEKNVAVGVSAAGPLAPAKGSEFSSCPTGRGAGAGLWRANACVSSITAVKLLLRK